jgi:hypothetical protein
MLTIMTKNDFFAGARFSGLIGIVLSGLLLSGCASSESSSDGATTGCGVVTDIASPVVIMGRFEEGDCLYSQLDPEAGDRSFVDEYRVTIPAAAVLTVTQRSTETNTFLLLVQRSESCIGNCPDLVQTLAVATDDNSGGGVNGTDAQIVYNVPAAGTYIILANQFNQEAADYTLELSTM